MSVKAAALSAGLVIASVLPALAAPTSLGEFGAWQAFKTAGSCYIVSQPIKREPDGLRRGPAYLFVTHRPGDSVEGEISIAFGYPLAGGNGPTVTAGDSHFQMVTQEETGWMPNAEEDARAVEAFKRAWEASVTGVSRRGNETIDQYDLTGFTKAYQAISKACDGADQPGTS